MKSTKWAPPPTWGVGVERTEIISLGAGGRAVHGFLTVPTKAWGLVLMPQATPGGAESPLAGYLARLIRTAGLATLVCELGGSNWSKTSGTVPGDLVELADRLEAWTDLIASRSALSSLPVAAAAPGVAFAAAVTIAARRHGAFRTLISCGGRPDVAGEEALAAVRAPTLFAVPEHDAGLLRMTRRQLHVMHCLRRVELVAGAHHQFSGHGTLGRLGVLLRRWLRRYLPSRSSAALDSPVLRLMLDRAATSDGPERAVTFRDSVAWRAAWHTDRVEKSDSCA